MRILMLAQFYPPIIGGEERHVRNLSIALAARGHDVTVATLKQNDEPESEIDEGVRVLRIRASMQRVGILFSEKGRQHSPPFPDPEVLLALRHIIMRERPDIIHAHNWIVHSFIPLKSWCKAKLVVTLHDYSLVCATKRYMFQGQVCSGPTVSKCLHCATEHYGAAKGVPTALANIFSGMKERKKVDMFLPVSQAVADGTRLSKYGVPYHVIPNFVPDDVHLRCDDTHPLLAQLPQEDFLLFVGDLVRDKGIEVLFQAYEGIESRIPLVLIGRPGADLSISHPANVRVLQSWPHEAVMSAWNRSTVALTPSIWPDPCPTVAMEAMAMGKPVIASKIGGLSDIVKDGESGLLVAPENPDALRDAIVCLLDNPASREQMGASAKQRVLGFKAKTVIPRIEQAYQEVLAAR